MTDTRTTEIDSLRRQVVDLGMAMNAYRALMAKPVWHWTDVISTLREADRYLPVEARLGGLFDACMMAGSDHQPIDPGIRSVLISQFNTNDARYRYVQLQLSLLDA